MNYFTLVNFLVALLVVSFSGSLAHASPMVCAADARAVVQRITGNTFDYKVTKLKDTPSPWGAAEALQVSNGDTEVWNVTMLTEDQECLILQVELIAQ